VDDELPPAAAKLTSIFRCDANEPGMGWYGVSQCPACGTLYFSSAESSFTGSQANDYFRLTRVSAETARGVASEILNSSMDKNNPSVQEILEACESLSGSS
jgi:hypothetical protein